MSKPEYETCTTAPHPWKKAHKCSADQNQVGWKLHIVKLKQEEVGRGSKVIDRSPSLCGLRPKHGWGLDMFIDAVCTRCEAQATKLGIEWEAP